MAFCRSLPERCGVVGDPQRGVLRPTRARPAPRALRLLQAPRGARRGGRAAGGSASMSGDAAHRRDPARHRVERPRRQLRPPRPDDRRRRRRRRRAGAAAPRRSRPASPSTTPDLGEPEGGPSSTFLADQARRARRVGRRLVPGDPGRRAGRRPAARTTASCSPAPTAPSHRYRKIHPFTYGGEEKHFRAGDRVRHRRHRRPAGQPVRLLRPALRRRVLAARPRHRRLPRARQLAGEAAPALDRRCCRRGRSRTRRTSSASTGSARAAASPTAATAASSTRSASCWPPPPTPRRSCSPTSPPTTSPRPRPLPLPPGPPLTTVLHRVVVGPIRTGRNARGRWPVASTAGGPLIEAAAWSSGSATSPPSTASTSRSAAARRSGSSARTAPASRRRCG